MSDALVWGFRSLDPALRGIMSSEQQYPLAIGQSSKNIIMMTDGRPYDRPWTGPAGGDVNPAKIIRPVEGCVCTATIRN